MSDRNPNEKTDDEEQVLSIEKMKCPVDDKLYEGYFDKCPVHDVELEPIDPEEDDHLL